MHEVTPSVVLMAVRILIRVWMRNFQVSFLVIILYFAKLLVQSFAVCFSQGYRQDNLKKGIVTFRNVTTPANLKQPTKEIDYRSIVNIAICIGLSFINWPISGRRATRGTWAASTAGYLR